MTVPAGFTAATMYWDKDMSLTPRKVSGAKRVGLRLSRRLRTPRGHCLGHPNDGIDISDMIQSTMTQTEAIDLRAAIVAECKKDPCVTTCFASVTLATSTNALTIQVQAFGAFGKTTVTFTQLTDGTLSAVIS